MLKKTDPLTETCSSFLDMADQEEKCPRCQKDLCGQNNWNKRKHIEACLAKKSKRMKVATAPETNYGIKNFFPVQVIIAMK